MAKRTTALCDGRIIGIESIYTVKDGKRINIAEKLERLRDKGKRNELFCPCGCKANVTVVAGDRNLREQHFRLKTKASGFSCKYKNEDIDSYYSKIVLKCWLDDVLQTSNTETRVPICDVGDTDRKYELSFLSKEKGVAIDYCYNRINLTDEKLEVLQKNSQGINIFHIVDYKKNGEECQQYPEALMKIQKEQGYCLFLKVKEDDYKEAEMEASFFAQDTDGFWVKNTITSGALINYSFDEDGKFLFNHALLENLFKKRQEAFELKKNAETKRRKEEKEKEERILEQRRAQWEADRKRQEEEYAKRRADAERRNALSQQYFSQEKKQKEEEEHCETEKIMAIDFEAQEEQIFDKQGKQWVQCRICKKKAPVDLFSYYGGQGTRNLGICKECINKPEAKIDVPIIEISDRTKKNNVDKKICPNCGGKLVEKEGLYGPFMGCLNYPKCKYTRSKYKF